MYDVLINGADVTACVTHTRYGDVLPSSKALAGAGIEMIDRETANSCSSRRSTFSPPIMTIFSSTARPRLSC